ncbi:cupin domain-containing protein [Pelagibacterium lentulum]|uniref:Cupin 2 domain-containing protein n=1 Tax=Pelagibacterium lentulum TaxID=2029865 RepID=A0A916VY64_9HYPH|nr:cupin domain-containing protein [Pelagibacterium lentulum]GGA52785.1 cupin 2 domain-containing protein [Pelagibacterium lentulum]
MITITTRTENQLSQSSTARFDGIDHGAGVSIFWVNAKPNTGPGLHWHPYAETWVVISGEALVRADGDELRVVAGDIVTVGPRTIHAFKNCGTDRLEMVCIHASPEIIQEFVD